MQQLEGKIAVVTGGASGIGLALGERLRIEGMRIVLADVEPDALEAAVAALGDDDVIGVACDVSDRASVEALAARTLDAFGAVHVVCNNAGVGPGGVTWEVPESVWDWVLGVNLMGVVNGISAFVPRLVEQDEGHVVNTSSVAGLLGFPGMAAYCASKHAIVGLSQALQQDLELAGSSVGVTVVCPGATRTRMNDSGRNWPERLGPTPATGLAPGHPAVTEEFLRTFPEIAIDPAEVAERVVEAIKTGRFWLLTERGDPESWLGPHYRGIIDGSLPATRVA
jgi:NAD(P)-dependent dehydrogenase (short-subunit alcohol dehydrogenase family)